MEHFSDEWIAALDQVVVGHAGLAAATSGRHLAIEYRLRSSPGSVPPAAPFAPEDPATGDRTYTLVLDDGHNRCIAGSVAEPDITISTDRRTAAAVATHAESAQTAFMAGRIRLGGDVRKLMANQLILAAVDDAAQELREATTFVLTAGGGAGA